MRGGRCPFAVCAHNAATHSHTAAATGHSSKRCAIESMHPAAVHCGRVQVPSAAAAASAALPAAVVARAARAAATAGHARHPGTTPCISCHCAKRCSRGTGALRSLPHAFAHSGCAVCCPALPLSAPAARRCSVLSRYCHHCLLRCCRSSPDGVAAVAVAVDAGVAVRCSSRSARRAAALSMGCRRWRVARGQADGPGSSPGAAASRRRRRELLADLRAASSASAHRCCCWRSPSRPGCCHTSGSTARLPAEKRSGAVWAACCTMSACVAARTVYCSSGTPATLHWEGSSCTAPAPVHGPTRYRRSGGAAAAVGCACAVLGLPLAARLGCC